jgi:hypothetical protein
MPKSKTHVKPTKEELLETEKALLEEVEVLKDEPVEEVVEPVIEEESEIEAEPEEEVVEEEEEEPKQDLKKKLSASARENQKIYAKNRVINQALTDAEDIPEPTTEEMTKEFTDWDLMSDTEKTFAKETVISRRWRGVISEAKNQATKIEKWNDSVDEFTDDPQTLIENPALEGRSDEFKKFAQEETNNSVPFKILVSAFLHENSSGKTSNKGSMFDQGSGGPNTKPVVKSDKLTIEEGRALRETNYDEWARKLKAGKIDQGI